MQELTPLSLPPGSSAVVTEKSEQQSEPEHRDSVSFLGLASHAANPARYL